jgi:hypothetical protein
MKIWHKILPVNKVSALDLEPQRERERRIFEIYWSVEELLLNFVFDATEKRFFWIGNEQNFISFILFNQTVIEVRHF